MVNLSALVSVSIALLLSPLLNGIINKTKAWFAGKQGPPLDQKYRDIIKLFRKGSIYADKTSWLFKAGPVMQLSTIVLCLFLLPQGGETGVISFKGDVLLLVYLLGLGRFFSLLSAFDTGSSFEQMGASREAFYSALTEPVLLTGLCGLSYFSASFLLGRMYGFSAAPAASHGSFAAMIFIAAAFFIVLLTENARLPVDDPRTHLELTMIHEVMILDHSGVDLALIEYAGSLKLWIFSSLFVGIFFRLYLFPFGTGLLLTLGLLVGTALLIGILESSLARLKLIRIPHLLMTAFVLSALWIIWVMI